MVGEGETVKTVLDADLGLQWPHWVNCGYLQVPMSGRPKDCVNGCLILVQGLWWWAGSRELVADTLWVGNVWK